MSGSSLVIAPVHAMKHAWNCSASSAANTFGAVADELGIDDEAGVAILSVRPNSIAASIGFRTGDMIVQVLQQPIDSLATLERTLKARQRLWTVAVKRGGQVLRIEVPG